MWAGYSDDRDQEGVAAQQLRSNLMLAPSRLQSARTVPQPELRTSPIFQNPVHLRPKTLAIQFEDSGFAAESDESKSLVFCLDATSGGTLSVYRDAIVSVDGRGVWVVESAAWASPAVPFVAGLAQRRSVEWVALPQPDSGSAPPSAHEPPGPCVLLLDLRSEEGTSERSWCRLGRAGSPGAAPVVEAVRQQVCHELAGAALETHEVYCSDLGADGVARQDCVVCQSEPRDTVVLPCRHLCFCSVCSETVRTRVQHHSYRCPLCRERISSMMRVDGSAEEA